MGGMDVAAAPALPRAFGISARGGYHRSRTADRVGDVTADRESAQTERQLPDQAQLDREARRAEEAALLARIVERDERAVEALYAKYSGPLYSLAYQVTGADRFAQDVVQEVFIAVWKDAARFDPARGAVGPWLFSLARHKAIDLVRREANVRKRTADVDMELGDRARRRGPRGLAEPASRPRPWARRRS